MNREQAAEIWPIMKAFAEGKDVQWTDDGIIYSAGWNDTQNPHFDVDLKWRVKPKPRKVWVNDYADGSVSIWESREKADKYGLSRIACHEIEIPPTP